MSINLRLSSSANGTRNTYDQTVNLVSDYGAVSGGSQATNSAAVSAFNTAYAGFSGHTQLIIPAGTYNFNTAEIFAELGGSRLTISAYGATLSNVGGFANSGPNNDWTHHANFDTVSAGAHTIQMADTSLFTAGKWVWLTAIDMQGVGYPPNPGIHEFKQIASKDSTSLTFTEPLLYSYKSTYPNYEPGNPEIYQGGPATVYVLRDPWNQEINFKGAAFTDTGNLFYGKCRVAEWTDCTFATYGPCPTMNVLFRSLRCTGAGTGGLEVDKGIQRAEFIDSMHRAVDFQSASVNDLYVLNMIQTGSNLRWRGGGRSNYFKNLSTSSFEFGTMNFGVMGPTYMEDVVAAAGTWMFFNKFPFSDYTEEGGGVLSYADGPVPASRVGYWAVPGEYCVLCDNNATPGFAQSFQVLDVTATGGRTYVTTTLPYPLPGTINGKSPPWAIYTHPCRDVTMVNCSGNSLFTTQSALPANSPLFGWTL
jgi:hypothetical protein